MEKIAEREIALNANFFFFNCIYLLEQTEFNLILLMMELYCLVEMRLYFHHKSYKFEIFLFDCIVLNVN